MITRSNVFVIVRDSSCYIKEVRNIKNVLRLIYNVQKVEVVYND